MSTILLVDDMDIFREPMAAALRHHGYATICAVDGLEALKLMQDQRPDLILLDVAMPRMNGLAFLEAIRSNNSAKDAEIPVILLTAVAEKDYVLRAAKLGVRDYLLKSRCSLDEMLSRVRRYVLPTGPVVTPISPPPMQEVPTKQALVPPHTDRDPLPPSQANLATAGPLSTASRPGAVNRNAAAAPLRANPVDALKQIKPIVTRSYLQGRIEAIGEIKALSPTVAAVLELTARKECCIDAVAKAIMRDQAISLKILKLANSVAYTRGEPVESVQKAVMRIGLSQIRQAVMNISVIDRFGSEAIAGRLDTHRFWEHSIACGLIAAELTHAQGGKEAEANAAFTMGLLHDVGRMVYAEQIGEQYAEVLEAAERLQLPLEQVESRMLLVSHADVMDRVLHLWRFPKDLINPIALHHLSIANIRHMAPQNVTEVATLALADRFAHALLLGSSGNLCMYSTEDFCSALRVTGATVRRIQEVIPEQTREIRLSMLMHARESHAWPQLDDELRKCLPGPIRPLFISSEPETDAYRLFSEALATPALGNERPNMAVIRIGDARERILVTTLLRQAEAAAQTAHRLPVILISSTGNLRLEESAMAERRCELLASPTPIARFIDAVNRLVPWCDATASTKAAG